MAHFLLNGFVVLLLVAFALYVVAVGIAYLFSPKWLYGFKRSLRYHTQYAVAIPSAALGAFGVVSLFWSAFPPRVSDSIVSLTVFSLEFTGPGGPVTLWLACFLGIIAAVKVLEP